MEYFAISDIHGQNEKFEKLLSHWNVDTQQLVLLGDYIDRGPNSLAVLQKVKQLKESYGAIVNMGNHEDLFLGWFENPNDPDDVYFQYTGLNTILSFLRTYSLKKSIPLPYVLSSQVVHDHIQETYPEIIEFIKEMSLYTETESFIFSHAGFNVYLADWKKSSLKDFLWSRNSFIYNRNETGKIAVFGHTNTCLLHSDKENTGIWVDQWKSKICIDGGAGSNKSLNGVVLNSNDGLENVIVYQT